MKKKVKTKATKPKGKRIRVGGIEMNVYTSTASKDKNLRGRWGYVNYPQKKIVLCKGLTPEERSYVMLHELIHTVDTFCEGPFRSEKQVRHFSQHLWDAIRECMQQGIFRLNELQKPRQSHGKRQSGGRSRS